METRRIEPTHLSSEPLITNTARYPDEPQHNYADRLPIYRPARPTPTAGSHQYSPLRRSVSPDIRTQQSPRRQPSPYVRQPSPPLTRQASPPMRQPSPPMIRQPSPAIRQPSPMTRGSPLRQSRSPYREPMPEHREPLMQRAPSPVNFNGSCIDESYTRMKKSCERIAAVLGLEKPILDGEQKPLR